MLEGRDYMNGDITVELVRKDDINKVVKILDNVTEDLINKGINQWEYPWDREIIIRDILGERVFLVNYKNQPIATFSIRSLNESDNEFYMNKKGKYLYRLAIMPSVQGLGLGSEILTYIREDYDFTHEDLYLDCWNGNEKLKHFYSKAGFEYLGDYKEEDYHISIFKINDFAVKC